MSSGSSDFENDHRDGVYAGDMPERAPYETDLTDEEWSLIEPTLTAWREERRFITVATTPLREIVDAIMYQSRTGCQWRLLPHDFPPHTTVYNYFSAWRDDGTDQKVHDLLRRRVRRDAGRNEEPTAMSMDSQSVDSAFSAQGNGVGFDGNKKRQGRKRHTGVDTLGLLLKVIVTGANVHDLRGGKRVIDEVAEDYPTVTKAWADQAYISLPEYAAGKGIDVEITSKALGVSGFTPVPQRWKQERTYGWFSRSRRLSQDYETRTDSSRSQILWAMSGIMMRRISGRTPVTRYRRTPNTQAVALA
jgi:transposase